MNKQWSIKKEDKEKEEILKKISLDNDLELNDLLIKILANRQIDTLEKLNKYLNPTRESFYDPFLMIDMPKAVDKIIWAIENNKKITIYGDYDVDGVTSSYILKNFFKKLNVDVNVYIPNRLDEGYGLNQNAIEQLASNGTELIITVDCGITAIEEVKRAYELGMEVVITDHHEPGKEIPKCEAVVDCKRKESTYPFSELAGCGVAFKLVMALSKKLNLPEFRYLQYLDIASIGTIADIVPLVDENRVIAKLGIKLLKQTKNLGVFKLLNSIGYKTIDSTSIAYGIAPRINACGRMGDATITLDLFEETNTQKAEDKVKHLNQYNLQRQEKEKEIFNQAIDIIDKKQLYNNKIMIVAGDNWHHGVIGIVASKIVDKYNKPTILVSKDENILKGSGRSIKGYNLFETLLEIKDDLKTFGRHSMAIGISFENTKLEDIQNKLNEIAKENRIDEIIPKIDIDMEVNLEELKIEDIEQLEILEPFGQNNLKPIFMITKLSIVSIRTLTDGKHIKILARKNNSLIDIVGFNLGYLAQDYIIGDQIDIAGNIDINEFNGKKSLQIVLSDMRKSI